jgi:hypothetical protein
LSGKEREKKPRCIDLLSAKNSKSKGKIMVSKQPCLSVKVLCGPAPCDGGTTTLIKEAAGCLFDLKMKLPL